MNTIPDFEARLAAWDAIGRYWRTEAAEDPRWQTACRAAGMAQPFFTAEFVALATSAWAETLRADRLRAWWVAGMGANPRLKPVTVAVVMAGNLPWVGLHDVLSVSLSGCRLLLKPAAKDRPLWEFWYRHLWPYPDLVQLTDTLDGQAFDAVIATGSDNSFRYFDYRFRGKPSILRHHRTSCAVLSGHEDEARLSGLWQDMLLYFGMGCRNVSVLFVPRTFDWARFTAIGRAAGWHRLLDQAAYRHQYVCRKALLDMQGLPYRDGECVLFEEGRRMAGMASVTYEVYDGPRQVTAGLAAGEGLWQCVVAEDFPVEGVRPVAFGQAQFPSLTDYADGVSILGFLKENFAI